MKSIEKKIKTVEERVQRLRKLAEELTSFTEYQVSPDVKDITERNIQVAIEACLDIAKIIISREGLKEPKDNKGVFTVLAEAHILSETSLEFLIPMTGTRNILVHGYDRIEDALIYGIVKKHLDDFSVFLAEVKDNYLRRLSENSDPTAKE
ncbi:MAG: DUF86 domain-containing protein [Deltaproteobacteria bacterium]|nr:DUF86 domain-containing protein [Deltaproteobacteria bacterium]